MTFVISFCIFSRKRDKKQDNDKTTIEIEKIINSKYVNIIGMILTILLLYFKMKYNNATRGIDDLSKLRIIRFSTMFNSYAESVTFEYIVVGVLNIYTIIFSMLLVEKKYKNKLFFICLVDILLYITIGYGRKILQDILIYVIMWFIIKNNGKIRLRIKTIMTIFLVTILILMGSIGITAIRTGVSILNIKKVREDIVQEQVNQYIIYFNGGFRTLDKFIHEDKPMYSLGRMTLGGIDEIISLPFIFMGYNYKSINTIMGEKLQENITVGQNIQMNAFYTCVMNFYSDFGIIGVILIPLIYAYILTDVIKKSFTNKNVMYTILLLFMISNTISATYKWFYQSGSTMFTIFIILITNLVLRKKEKKNYGR